MIFTRLIIDNYYCFDNTELDLTIKREVKYSTIEHEFLDQCPSFRYKRVCILSGANASGKTSLGNIMNNLQHALCAGHFSALSDHISDKSKVASLSIEFVTTSQKAPRIHLLKLIKEPKHTIPAFEYASVPIGKRDSSAKARQKVESIFNNPPTTSTLTDKCSYLSSQHTSSVTLMEDFFQSLRDDLNWGYLLSDTDSTSLSLIDDYAFLNKNILKAVLQTFDSSITEVTESRDDTGVNGYSIKFMNKDSVLIDREGKAINMNRLSKGTYDAIQVAGFVSWVIEQQHSKDSFSFFMDEKMAYSHSEIEQAIVNLIIQKLGRNSQFFYTTHNYDVLDMNLPIHSFVFLAKQQDKAIFVHPEQQFKKNDRSLLNYIKNNVFNTIPNTGLIDELIDYE
ncbi:ATP-binding protein [Pelistega europaea]|uniref:ATP-binding protein n=1 Tax=Pelistega europaea TaxID=106147 RepID=A0A7Y4L836_9BURK|nr:ATP-binding protein [Pelistega europaea]NOL48678.1 ATP-binding protein [Pelistega europaea]